MSEDTDGWLPHDGKGMPVKDSDFVDVRYADGQEEFGLMAVIFTKAIGGHADNWWLHQGDAHEHIVAYRIHQPSPSKESAS